MRAHVIQDPEQRKLRLLRRPAEYDVDPQQNKTINEVRRQKPLRLFPDMLPVSSSLPVCKPGDHKKNRDIKNRVLITPHAAFYAEESRIEMRRKAAEAVKRLIEGKPLRNCVNKKWLKEARYEVV